MSAAEPATPPTPRTAVNTGEAAAVIDINVRRTERRAAKAGGWTIVDTPPLKAVPDPTASASVSSSEQTVREAELRLVADDLEKVFNAGGRTLSDPETAEVFVTALRIAEHALKGSVVGGIISQAQLGELVELLDGLREAPRLV